MIFFFQHEAFLHKMTKNSVVLPRLLLVVSALEARSISLPAGPTECQGHLSLGTGILL